MNISITVAELYRTSLFIIYTSETRVGRVNLIYSYSICKRRRSDAYLRVRASCAILQLSLLGRRDHKMFWTTRWTAIGKISRNFCTPTRLIVLRSLFAQLVTIHGGCAVAAGRRVIATYKFATIMLVTVSHVSLIPSKNNDPDMDEYSGQIREFKRIITCWFDIPVIIISTDPKPGKHKQDRDNIIHIIYYVGIRWKPRAGSVNRIGPFCTQKCIYLQNYGVTSNGLNPEARLIRSLSRSICRQWFIEKNVIILTRTHLQHSIVINI